MTVRALEARALVGGRTWNAELGDGSALELGGEWVGPGQREIMRLPATLNVPFAR
ncbi:FAD-dependent oxidoreductase [Amycolatopsis jejuensis]|uniref:FAD-dependent oxidoreductase n=1 Tax=Amycolatopsis jejuensis TaxID=330084 RepID=UPI000AC7333D|nr:FAD-dependent oxidoreductase [Amycolatopsis jejuensis]